MWIADKWNDYKVLDTGNGEKLEGWGKYRLIRPDPQVIWNRKTDSAAWKKPSAHYFRSEKGGGSWEFYDLPETWTIRYALTGNRDDSAKADRSEKGGTETKTERGSPEKRVCTFNLKPFSFKHTGVFPEQAVNWDWSYALIRERIRERTMQAAQQRPVNVLNLFAYTGGATLAALAAGASVTHVDASKGIVAWAKENAAASGLSDAPVRWIVDDCRKFVEREIRRGKHYDAIIMDPPSYGRGPGGEVWKMEECIFPFIELCAELMSDDPLFFLINSYSTGLQPGVLKYMLDLTLTRRLGGHCEAEEIGLPVENSPLILPQGASGRWVADDPRSKG